MAEGNGDSGSKDRATVALVGAKVDEVKAIVAGHAATTVVQLEAIKEKIEPLALLPDRMARLETRQENCETHIGRIWHTLDTLQTDEVTELRGRNADLSDRPRKWLLGVGLPIGLVMLGWFLQHGF